MAIRAPHGCGAAHLVDNEKRRIYVHLQPALDIRVANGSDLPAINALERRCFERDAQSTRSLRYLLCRANAVTLLAQCAGAPMGYVILLLRKNSRIARLYSIAVDPAYRGRGVGPALVRAAQVVAVQRAMVEMRLEVRVSNRASRQMFTHLGYQTLQLLTGYYPGASVATREAGVRMRKSLLTTPQNNG